MNSKNSGNSLSLLYHQKLRLIEAPDFPDFIKTCFLKENKDQIGDVYFDFLRNISLIDIANSKNIPISHVIGIIRKNASFVGIFFQHYVAKKLGGKVNSEFYHEGIDVLGKNGEIYSCKYITKHQYSMYFNQKKNLNNEREYALQKQRNYYLVLINPIWKLTIMLLEVNPNDSDIIIIKKCNFL